MTSAQLQRDQANLFRDFSGALESITIAGVAYACLCLGDRRTKEVEWGGFNPNADAAVALERGKIADELIPQQGATVQWRGTDWQVVAAVLDHPQSPIKLELRLLP